MLYPDIDPLPSKRNSEQSHQRRTDRERLPEMRREGHSVCDLSSAEVSNLEEKTGGMQSYIDHPAMSVNEVLVLERDGRAARSVEVGDVI